MEISKAKDTIASLFNNRFDKVSFTSFISNLLNSASFASQSLTQNNQINDQFKDHIESLERLTTFSDENDNKIDVLIITLLKDTALDRARTMQRNFVARYLSENYKDAALVAFVFPESSDWRFSLISMDSRYEGTKLIDEYTPAKRWSFLVGKHEGSHTAQRQLLEILANDIEDPSLEELIEAFNIETVSKEFYEKYRTLFDRMTENLKELIETDSEIEEDFRVKQIKPEDFARKTMGQIAFLYFLQKKGWFGVKPGAEWGTGVRNFVRVLFERRESYGSNFFNDVLEPLFYEALALDRGMDAIYPRLNNVRMPFLNGGLFEPLNGYSWETTNITLPDEFFSNETVTKEGDIGDGILDIFDRYNFTVNESEPLEVEVAVDPEMLGKVFENLLPENIRKGKGAYYTPRVIVHYMCQESLINYLDTELGSLVKKEAIEGFIRDESSQLDLTDELKNCAKSVDDLLANIKVCDPAVGSGAFPLGLLNEIVKARVKIGEYIDSKYSIYDLKLHAISNSIYGVDLDPGAIEIAKLRFWLSLVVEEDIPSPLPNLDHKIMQGNSLISEYEGIKLFDDDFLHDAESNEVRINEIEIEIDNLQKKFFSLHEKGEYTNTSKAELDQQIKPLNNKLKLLKNQNSQYIETEGLFEEEQPKKIAQQKAKTLQAKVSQHISTHSQSDKERLKQEIEYLKWDLIESTLEENGEEAKLDEIKSLRRQRIKPFFIWELEFGDVFKNNGGFDIVIANPPYIRLQNRLNENFSTKYSDLYENIGYKTFKRTGDIYGLFYELGINKLKMNGHLTYITSNKWLRAGYGVVLRAFFTKFNPKLLFDFGGFKVFESATVDVNIIIVNKEKNQNKLQATKFRSDFQKGDSISRYFEKNKVELKNLSSDIWFIGNDYEIALKHKIENIGIPLKDCDVNIYRGILTGYNAAFIIDEAKREELILKDPKSEEIIKPMLRGKDVQRYDHEFSQKYLIDSHNGYSDENGNRILAVNIDTYPAVKEHLDHFWNIISKRQDRGITPYNLRNCAYYQNFSKEKVVWTPVNSEYRFAILPSNYFFNNSLFMITGEFPKIICSCLNSSLLKVYLSWVFGDDGTYTYASKEVVETTPIPILTSSNSHLTSQIEELVELRINNGESEKSNIEIEQEIDQLVYELYELTDDEIELIENSNQ